MSNARYIAEQSLHVDRSHIAEPQLEFRALLEVRGVQTLVAYDRRRFQFIFYGREVVEINEFVNGKRGLWNRLAPVYRLENFSRK
jgi:hypothetical protein